MKRRIAATLAVALYVLAAMPRGEQVPLITVEGQTCCVLYGGDSVVDVKADRTYATVVSGTDTPLRWPAGYTAWRVGSEIEVREPGGAVALRTPGRYRITATWPDYVVGHVARCSSCELGTGSR